MPDIHNYLLQYLQILWGSLFFPQFLHTMSEANFTSWDAFRFPTRWVECFRFGNGVIVMMIITDKIQSFQLKILCYFSALHYLVGVQNFEPLLWTIKRFSESCNLGFLFRTEPSVSCPRLYRDTVIVITVGCMIYSACVSGAVIPFYRASLLFCFT